MGDSLLTVLDDDQNMEKLLSYYQRCQEGEVVGLEESGKNLLLANLYNSIADNLLIITTRPGKADKIYEDLVRLVGEEEVLLFPRLEILPHESLEIEETVKLERLKVLERLFNDQQKIVLTPISALLEGIVPPEVYKERIINFKRGEEIEVGDLTNRLVRIGYERVGQVQDRGQFSIRGGIIDLYPYTEEDPIRLELFGDEIESIRKFEVISQRSTTQLDGVSIGPATEFIFPEDLQSGIKNIRQDLEETLPELSISARKNLKQRVEEDLEKLQERINFPGVRQYLNYFYKSATLLNYFNGTLIVDNWKPVKQRAVDFLTNLQERFSNLLKEGKVLSKYRDHFIDFNDVLFKEGFKKLYLSPTRKKLEEISSQFMINFIERQLEAFQGQLKMFIEEVKSYYKRNYKIVIGLSNIEKAERLKERLREDDLPAVVVNKITNQIQPENIILTVSNLNKGFVFPKAKFAFYTETELFKQPHRKRKRRGREVKQGAEISSFTDLDEGDYVVHENHGIGRYLGIKTVKIQDKSKDYLLIEYSGNDKLYVPTQQVDLIQKYVGMGDKRPNLHKLDSDSWSKAKARVKESVEEMAEELLKLYAKREMKEGYSFSEDTEWQTKFEADFPYQETEDQLKAIEEVKEDMESKKPMDRLLCGDVGYGKTEVAVRAMFKAVMDGKQVAFLVPTTILAQQHWNTFLDRFSNFPVNIEMISRFRSPKEQKQIIENLEEGSVDIVVGTHRLLSKDINFDDLGLIVVDEEQRFGVRQKERLKQFKENVDVLTLTATPIPRTLHMSLVGIRDISLIETPPQNRYPIRTYVGEYDEELVEEALVRELNRGGQVYFVHNRVKDIKEVAARIQKLVPQAEVAVAHGQMGESKLERLMLDFWEGEYDVLVCTTIIENGMDISNVNTILINRADKMGLAQLYQLRGRVGRSNQIAYAYLLYDEDEILSEVAEKRLKAIKEFTSLGSGFKIAMRDLELRGAGNILGPEQHGHIETVGFSLYCKLLEQAIKNLKEEKEEEEKSKVNLELDVNAYIPEEYIQDSKQKIEVYRDIKRITNFEEYRDLKLELKDRFGKLLPPVKKLLKIAQLRIKGRKLLLQEVKEQKGKLKLKFSSETSIAGKDVLELGRNFNNLKFISDKEPRVEVKSTNLSDDKKIDLLLEILDFLID